MQAPILKSAAGEFSGISRALALISGLIGASRQLQNNPGPQWIDSPAGAPVLLLKVPLSGKTPLSERSVPSREFDRSKQIPR